MKKKIKSSKYLYNISASEFADMKYIDALHYKINKAKELLNLLVDVSYLERDNARLNDVLKAIQYNEELIEEVLYG